MPDLDKLTPAERATQLGKPEGDVGIAVGEALNRVNSQVIPAAWRSLELAAGMDVLEIGFGNGHTLPAFLAQAKGLRYTGIEISETMVAEAIRFNEPLVSAGQAAFRLASVEAMPFANASFDRVVAVNVIYFLFDPVPALKQIRRVLRPSGLSVIAGVDPESVKSDAYAKPSSAFTSAMARPLPRCIVRPGSGKSKSGRTRKSPGGRTVLRGSGATTSSRRDPERNSYFVQHAETKNAHMQQA